MFVDLTLAARLEAAQAWRATHYARAALEANPVQDGSVVTRNDAQLVYGGPDRPVNRTIGLGMTAPVSAADLEAVEEFYRVRGAPIRVDLCPLADPTLVDLLRERRYIIERHVSILALPLPAELPAQDPTIEITRATAADAALWLRVSARGFDATETPDPQTLAVLAPNFYSANAACYFARIDGEPAGTGGLYDHGGVAELGGASTLVAFRRRGVQIALIARRLADAHAAGCDTALVITTPGTTSQRNMQRLGFVLAYTKTILTRPVD
jgi:hypothetical protein